MYELAAIVLKLTATISILLAAFFGGVVGYALNTKVKIYRRFIAEKELITEFEDFQKSYKFKTEW